MSVRQIQLADGRTGLERPSREGDRAPTLFLLHGFGSDEADLMGLQGWIDPRLRILAPRGHLRTEFGGFGWFSIRFDPNGEKHIDLDEVLAARSELRRLVEPYVAPGPVFLSGFSQGAMMSLGLALAEPAWVAGLVLMSGKWLPCFELPAEPSPFDRIPMLVQHGVIDEVLPIGDGREIRDQIGPRMQTFTYSEYPIGHSISEASAQEASEWLSSRLNASTP